MPVNVSELGRILIVLAQVRELLTEFPADPTLIAMRDALIAQAKETLS